MARFEGLIWVKSDFVDYEIILIGIGYTKKERKEKRAIKATLYLFFHIFLRN